MFFEVGRKLYDAFIRPTPAVQVPSEYVGIVQQVMQKVGWKTQVTGVDIGGAVGAPMPQNNRVAVALSGGLDSVYLMHRLIDAGYSVTAIHVSGLNKFSGKYEEQAARQAAAKAGATFVKAVFNAPKQHFPDNPFKNQLVLSMMLDIGIKKGIYQFALGSDWTTPLSEAVVGFTITDSIEVNRAYWAGVRQRFPQAVLEFIPDDVKKVHRLAYLFDRGALADVSSCVSPLRFRQSLHERNEQKYGLRLMPNRCGSCYKCAMEYILLVETGRIPKNARFYDHAWDTLATSKTAHRPDLFAKSLPMKKRMENLLKYGS